MKTGITLVELAQKIEANNAVTRASQDVESYDRATELEGVGGIILELPKSEWIELAVAA